LRFCNEIGIPHSKFLEEWSDEDRSKALAYLVYRGQFCESCGTAPWEWDPEQGGSRFAYEPKQEICPGCEKKDWARENGKTPAGGFITLVKPEE
jgi:hypothetical protein